MRRKRIPQRTCVGCREVSGKRQLVRLVRTLGGTVEIDESGKRPGRGTYLCRRRSCWEIALQKRRLEHSLRLNDPLTKENLDTLRAYLEALPEELD
jgi:predicted RNA-binding protein YlxR (DUF448 family)